MHEGVVSYNTPLLKSSSVNDSKPSRAISRFFFFWTTNGINGSTANPGQAPILQTKSVTKKQSNKCMAEIQDPGQIPT